jgi:CubicO group peptidase (beta-lactamase class C family)
LSNNKYSIDRAKFPEQVGVSSEAIAAFIDDLNESGIETHSLMFMRHGKVAFETWAEPYAPEIPHTMYSISKSVTSTAIGFAIDEGLLSLDTRVIDIFPEYEPDTTDENLEALNVFHLLTMTAGKDVSQMADKTKNQWIKDFFDAKWAFAPGEFWRYISENTYMLSAMLARVAGVSMTEYLTPRLYEPLGFDRAPFWEKDGNGIEAGGWGLFLTTEELAKYILCYQQGGKFNGIQVVPAWWVKESGKKQVDNLQYSEPASCCGYGYGVPMNLIPNSYRADGLFSQFGLIFSDYDACFVMTACEMFNPKTRDCLWRHFPAIFCEESGAPVADEALNNRLCLPILPDLPASPRSEVEKAIDNKILKIKNRRIAKELGFPVSMLIMPVVQLNYEKLGNIEEIRFTFGENECEMTWRERLYKNTIVCGMDGKPRKSKIRLSQYNFTASSTAAWESENTLCVWMRPLESIGQRRMKFVFEGDKVTVVPSSIPDAKSMMDFIAQKVPFYVKEQMAVKAAQVVLSKADRLLETKQKGKIKK